MAKARSIVKLSGTLGEITFVDSKAYGFHTRQKRTVYERSEGMAESSSKQTLANQMAKPIFDAVNFFAPNFKNGQFWSRLIAVFRKQQKSGEKPNYAGFNQLEVRVDYPSSGHGRFMLLGVKRKDEGAKHNEVVLHYHLNQPTRCLLSVLRIAASEDLLDPYPTAVLRAEVAKGQTNGELVYSFEPLPPNTQVLYVLKYEQMKNGSVTGLRQGTSVRFFKGD